MSSSIPAWALILIYWLHMLTTVVWIGGLAASNFILMPLARATLPEGAYLVFSERVLKRLQEIGWIALAVLVGTGLFQMSAHPAYQGFLRIDNAWAMAILLKHSVIGGMVLVSAWITWGLMPQLRRMNYLLNAGVVVDETSRLRLQRRHAWLVRLNLGLSVVVLLLTAWARVS